MSQLIVPVTATDHIQGTPDAAVTLVEYGDFECGYCGQAAPDVRRVQDHFGGRLRFAFRHFPLTEIHPFVEEAAEFAELAGAHGKFWEAHDQLYARQDELGFPLLADIAGRLGLAQHDLRAALARRTYAPRIRADFEGGVRSGVNGTPAFYVNGRRHDQAYDYDGLRTAIEARLALA